MNWDEQSILISLGEISILEGSREFSLPFELFQLSATFRSDQTNVIRKNLDIIRDQYELIKEWKTEKDILIISLTENFPIQEASEYEREKIYEKRIRRILLFKLYDVKSGWNWTPNPVGTGHRIRR